MNEHFKNTPITEPIEPEIELDGGYAYCRRCYTELDRWQHKCRRCGQLQDWNWLIQWEVKGKQLNK